MKNIVLIISFCTMMLISAFHSPVSSGYKITKVVIDAGHGGKDPGTSGAVAKEKDIALKIALKLGEIIKENIPDVEIIYTRNKNHFVELGDRARIANKNNADVFISIHCNASSKKEIHGTETYALGLHRTASKLAIAKRENEVVFMEDDYEKKYPDFNLSSNESHIIQKVYQNAYLENSLNLANKIETQFKDRVKRHSRGVKQAGFLVLWRTSMPSVLIEAGYLTNAKEEKYLNDELGQTYIASGIFRAFRDYKNEIESMN